MKHKHKARIIITKCYNNIQRGLNYLINVQGICKYDISYGGAPSIVILIKERAPPVLKAYCFTNVPPLLHLKFAEMVEDSLNLVFCG